MCVFQINCVRDAIDLALGTEESTAQWAPIDLAQHVQKPAKEKLLMCVNSIVQCTMWCFCVLGHSTLCFH